MDSNCNEDLKELKKEFRREQRRNKRNKDLNKFEYVEKIAKGKSKKRNFGEISESLIIKTK